MIVGLFCPVREIVTQSIRESPGMTVMRYDHGRENLEQNAVNFLDYDDEA